MIGRSQLVRVFLYTAVVLLSTTASAKLLSGFGSAHILKNPDPILDLQSGHLLFAAGTLELLVAGICLFSRWQTPPLILVAWLATNLLAYRIGLWWLGWHRPCLCLGNFTDAIHVSPQVADDVMKGVLAYLLIGSYAALFWLWQQRKKAIPVTTSV